MLDSVAFKKSKIGGKLEHDKIESVTDNSSRKDVHSMILVK